jgi:SAM-dependent methyltransferase
MVQGLLGPLVKDRSAEEILSLRVCDPAMGDGAFLVEVVQFLAEQAVAADARDRPPAALALKGERVLSLDSAKTTAAIRCVAGVDLDPASVQKARERLVGLMHKPLPDAHLGSLQRADAIGLDWATAYPSFDAVIANPPYIRQESLAGEAVQKTHLKNWRTYDGVADLYVYFIELAHGLLRRGGRYAVVVPNKWMTVEYARPLRAFLAQQNSVDAIVDLAAMKVFDDADAFPCVLFGTVRAAGEREIKATRTAASDSFDVVVAANAHVTRVDASSADDDWRTAEDDTITRLSTTRDVAMQSEVGVMTGGPAIITLDRARLDDGPWHIDSIEDAALLARLKRECQPLGEIIGTRWSRGVVTGCNEAFVIAEKTRDVLLAADPRPVRKARWLPADTEPGWAPPSSRNVQVVPDIAPRRHVPDIAQRSSDDPIATSELIRPFVKGRDIRSYALPHPPRWILLIDRGMPFEALPPAVREHLEKFRARLEPRPASVDAKAWKGRKPGAYAWHELQDPVVPLAKSRAQRMFYQDIQTAPLCALDVEGELVPDTTVWILPSQDLVLLAILNSAVYRWIAQRRFPPALNGAVRPKLQYMQQLPIPTVTGALRDDITSCVEQRIRHIREGENSKGIDVELAKLVGEAYTLSRKERELVMPSAPMKPDEN